MKKALVLAIALVMGLGIAAFAAGPFSGSWDTTVTFLPVSAFSLADFHSDLSLKYTVGGWTFNSVSAFDLTGFSNQYFTAAGNLGAFTIGSYLDFTPIANQTASFNMWLTGTKVSIAGVDLYGFFDLTDEGSGWLFGGKGTAGDLTVTAETIFNLQGSLIDGGYSFDDVVNGFADFAYANDPLHGCTTTTTIAQDAFALQTDSHCFCWSGTTIKLEFPFSCIDKVTLKTEFDTGGFSYFKATLSGINLSVPWLNIHSFNLKWTTATKTASVDMNVDISSTCLKPYFEVLPAANSGTYGSSGFSISGLQLYALGLSQKVGDVTFTSMTLFDTANYALSWGGSPVRTDLAALKYYCTNDFQEMFEIAYSADACCGGSFSFNVKNWFDISGSSPNLFGWGATEVSLSVGVGSNFTLSSAYGVAVRPEFGPLKDLNQYWQLGFTVTF